MNAVTTIIGWLCIAAISVAAAALAIALAADLCRRAIQRFEWAIGTKVRQEVGRSLDASGWWFSESPDTSLAIRIIGQRLARDESIDAGSMRDQWQKGRATPNATAEPKA